MLKNKVFGKYGGNLYNDEYHDSIIAEYKEFMKQKRGKIISWDLHFYAGVLSMNYVVERKYEDDDNGNKNNKKSQVGRISRM